MEEKEEMKENITNRHRNAGSMGVSTYMKELNRFLFDVLSEYYDTMNMGLEILFGILSATTDENFENQYVRNIHFGGGI